MSKWLKKTWFEMLLLSLLLLVPIGTLRSHYALALAAAAMVGIAAGIVGRLARRSK